MLQFNPNDPGDTPYKMWRAVKGSGLTLQQICERLKSDFDQTLTPSALSRSISRGTLRMQRAMEIFAICGVTEVEIKRQRLRPRQQMGTAYNFTCTSCGYSATV